MQYNAAQHLHVVRAQADDALGRQTHHRKSFGQQLVQRFALGQAVFKFLGFGF